MCVCVPVLPLASSHTTDWFNGTDGVSNTHTSQDAVTVSPANMGSLDTLLIVRVGGGTARGGIKRGGAKGWSQKGRGQGVESKGVGPRGEAQCKEIPR